jgi:hypothetical protein
MILQKPSGVGYGRRPAAREIIFRGGYTESTAIIFLCSVSSCWEARPIPPLWPTSIALSPSPSDRYDVHTCMPSAQKINK